MGFWGNLKKFSNKSEKKEVKKAKNVNQSPTEEQLKNNKKGRLSYLWTFFSIITYLLGFTLVAAGFDQNVAVGIIALIFVLSITPIVQHKAIDLANEQRAINGKGLFALILAYILPLVILAGGFFFFIFGGYHTWVK